MSLLEHPTAQRLLDETAISERAIQSLVERIDTHLERYRPCFVRSEQRENAALILRGKLSHLERKTIEPIAAEAGVRRRAVQNFVGAGAWSDDAVRSKLRAHVVEEIGHDDSVLIVDGMGVPKKGDASCGVARQWCGRLGKIDNCQVGVYLGYASHGGHALLDAQLYLPAERANDAAHRELTHVPDDVAFRTKWELARDLIESTGATVPHGWIVGDDEFGRVSRFRDDLRAKKRRYALDVPCNTLVRDLRECHPTQRPLPPYRSVAKWAEDQPQRAWRTLTVRDGEKGPLKVKAISTMVQAHDDERGDGPRERLVVIRSLESTPRTWYVLSNAKAEVDLKEIVRAHGSRHRIEELFAEGNGEVGLDHCEVRSWLGWHHHVTLSLLALWLMQVERRRLGKKRPG